MTGVAPGRPAGGEGTALRLDELDAVVSGLGVLTGTARPGQDPGGPHPLAGAVTLLQNLRAAGIAVAVVSARRDCAQALAAAGLAGLVDARVDGQAAAAMGLAGPPDPACFLEAAARLGADPGRAAVAADCVAGVAAGRRGGFGLVAGVAAPGDAAGLAGAGADLVVGGLGDLAATGRGPLADGWHLTYRPAGRAAGAGEGMRETLCTLGNGYFATRGARAEAADDGTHYPGTYLAGVYDRLRSQAAGGSVEHESIVNAPNWLPLSFSAAGGPWLGQPGAAVSAEELRLDLRSGVLLRRFRVTGPGGRRTLVIERRLVSMADPHLAAIRLDLVAENWAGTLRIRSGIDGTCCTDQTAEERLLSHCHLKLAGSGEDPPGGVWLAARTAASGILIAEAARAAAGGASGPGEFRAGARHAGHEWAVEVAEGARCRVEKVAAVYTSKDPAICEPVTAARQAAAEAPGFGELLAAHQAAWARLWWRALTEADAAGQPPGVVNLHLFHLLQVASPHIAGIDAGLGARGLHGEGYLGHVFWDELFVFRFLNLRFPEISRALLAYRYRRLPAARRLARQAGGEGARFPWQSGSDGRDETPVMLFNPRSGRWMPDRSAAQRHVGLAVAYNCWRYFEATGDEEFLRGGGAEVLFGVARHFAQLARFDEALGRWRIRGVMGPDEFHDGYPWASEPGVDDNACTNVLASWVLARAVELAGILDRDQREDVLGRLGIGRADLERFGQASRGLHVPFHGAVISQFAGYERLEPIDLGAYRARYGNIGRLDPLLEAEGDTVRRYQVAKQAELSCSSTCSPPPSSGRSSPASATSSAMHASGAPSPTTAPAPPTARPCRRWCSPG
ncbi:MAG TPA: HAD family hydrolase [Streptosporangiaceae bacterium]|nr:HAD family hydrolase [Streptosporangiaceae bacterium]